MATLWLLASLISYLWCPELCFHLQLQAYGLVLYVSSVAASLLVYCRGVWVSQSIIPPHRKQGLGPVFIEKKTQQQKHGINDIGIQLPLANRVIQPIGEMNWGMACPWWYLGHIATYHVICSMQWEHNGAIRREDMSWRESYKFFVSCWWRGTCPCDFCLEGTIN